MKRLALVTPANATDGLFVFVRARNGGGAFTGCIKLEFGSLERLWYTGKATPQDAIARIDWNDVLSLPKNVLKAAVIPNPTGNGDLRVVDNQLGDPASHWLKFLDAGARPREKTMTKVATAALTQALATTAQIAPAQADAFVADRLDQVAGATVSMAPKKFASEVAKAANVDPNALWKAAVKEDAAIQSPHYEVTPAGAGKLKSNYDLGDGIQLTGPTHVLERRVSFVLDGAGGYELRLPVPGPVEPRRG